MPLGPVRCMHPGCLILCRLWLAERDELRPDGITKEELVTTRQGSRGRESVQRASGPVTGSWTGDALSRAGSLPPARLVLWLGVALQGVLLTYLARNFWFAMDDWDMLLTRGTIPGESRGVWDPHNGHWSTIIIVIYRTLFEIFGLRSYLPYALVTIVMHLLITLVLHRILLRTGAGEWGALVGAWLVLFLGAGEDALLYSAAMNHLGSLLCGLGAVLVCLREPFHRRAQVATVLLLLGAVMFSGTGVPVVFFVVVFLALNRGVPVAAAVASVPAAAYLLWYALAGRHASNHALPADRWELLRIPELVWRGLSGSVGKAVGYADIGPALLLGLVVGVVLFREAPTQLRRLAWAGVIGAAAVAGILAASRTHLDPSTARYAYFTMLFLAPAVVLCAKGVVRFVADPRWLAGTVAAVLLLAYAANGVRMEREFALKWERLTRNWPDITLGMVAAIDAGERQLNPFSGDFYNADVTPSRVAHPAIRAELPTRPAAPTGRLSAESMFMVRVGTTSVITPRPGALSHVHSLTTDIEQVPGCRTYTASTNRPVLALGVQGVGNEFTVTSQSTEITTVVNRAGVSSPPRVWRVKPGEVVVSSTARGALLFVTLNAGGSLRLCM